MVSPYWFTKFSVLVLVIVGSCLALWIVFELYCWFAAWRRDKRHIRSSSWYALAEDVNWEQIRTYVAWLQKEAFERYADGGHVPDSLCVTLTWRVHLEFLPSQIFSCEYPNEFGIIPLTELDQAIDDERWTCYTNRMMEYAQNHTTFFADLAIAMKSVGFSFKVNSPIVE